MRLASWIVVAAVVLALPHLAQAGGGFLPPLEIEVGRASIETPDGPAAPATQVMVGISWASLYPRPTPIDISVGWMGSFGPDRDPAAAARMAEVDDESDDAHGVFVALELRAAEGRHWRTWIGGRGELLDTHDVGVLGGFGRVSTELWAPTVAGARGGGIYGTIALTAWAEVGVRERADRSLASVVAAGLGVRLPLIAAGN